MTKSVRSLVLAMSAAAGLQAQQDSRLAILEEQQQAKAERLTPEQQNKVERGLNWFRDKGILETFQEGINGWRVKLGGMAPGSGFAAGPEFHNANLWGGRTSFRASAQQSTRGYRKFDFELALPKVGDRFFAQLNGVDHNYNSLPYYGSGPDSEKTGRTDFRLEDTAVDATFGARFFRRLTAAGSAGYLLNNIGPGSDSRFASAETVYAASQAPGIDRQTSYFRSGGFVQFDWRDPDGPRRGGNYFAQFNDYRDRSLGTGSFQRLDIEAQQYVSALNQRRVFALRAHSVLTFHDPNQVIPFYMQPSLGGSEDLRGYRPFRFRGDNLMVMNAEYRWEVFSGLDMALFGDAGKVVQRKGQLNFRDLESDAGFGFRFNARNKTFLRLDFGFSHEGFQIWVKFNSIFRNSPVHTASGLGDQ